VELWQYYRILRKRKWLIVVGTLVCVGIVAGALYLTPQKWEAYTTVMEKSLGDEEVTIFAPAYYLQFDPKMRLANLTQLVKSQTVLQRTAETLWRLQISSDPERILSTLNARPLGATNILMIMVQSGSKEEAKATADVVAVEFMRFYNELNSGGAARSKQFIENEVPKAEKRLNDVREAIREFKEESGAVMLPRQTDALIQRMAQLQTSLTQYEMQAQQARAAVESLDAKLQDLLHFPETRTASTIIASNPFHQSLQTELARQEIELHKMLKDRTLEHPGVKALREQIAQTRAKLEEAETTILNSTTETTNPIRDSLVQTYVSSHVAYLSADAGRAAAREVIASLQPELQSLPAQEMRLAQLSLDEQATTNTYTLLLQKLDEATIKEQEAENLSSIQIVDPAQARPANPRKTLKVMLALLLAPMLCAGIAFLLNYLDNTVKTPAEAEELLKLPVFAIVPIARAHSLVDGKHLPAIGTSYQMLSTNLWIGNSEVQGRTVLVASAEPDVGRSTTAANLAVTLARDGAKVILVDSDLRQPAQHAIFGVENDKGLSNILAGQLALKDALKPTSVTDLLLIPSGPLPANPVRLFRSPEMTKFVSEVNDLADFVVFDSPAGITFADTILLAAMVKNVLIVHAAGTVPRGAEVEFRTRLEQVQANLLGAVLNMVRPEDSHGYYHFRSAYDELMQDGKYRAALAPHIPGAVSEEASQEGDKAGTTES